MSTFGCEVCGRQLSSKELRDKHQKRCEDLAYAHVHVERQRTIARQMACGNCGKVHSSEANQIACDEEYAQRDQAFAVWQEDQILEQMERQRR